MPSDRTPQCQACFKDLDLVTGAGWDICYSCREAENSFQEAEHEPYEVEDWVRFVLTNCRNFIKNDVTVCPYMFSWEEVGKTHIRPFPSLLTAQTKEELQYAVRRFHEEHVPSLDTHVAFLLGHFGQYGVEGRLERFIWFLTFSKNPVFQIIITQTKDNTHRVSSPVLMKEDDESNPCT